MRVYFIYVWAIRVTDVVFLFLFTQGVLLRGLRREEVFVARS